MSNLYGLIGKNISYSFSRNYFNEKFRIEKLDGLNYVNFDLPLIEDFQTKVRPLINEIGGLNVTIPYKEKVMDYLDEIDPEAAQIGAVNTIKVLEGNRLKGYNTDVFGFEASLTQIVVGNEKKALILGTGGASKAVAYVLNKLGISSRFVSRNRADKNSLTYSDLTKDVISQTEIIVNCTPLGTHPETEKKPDLPYQYLSSGHVLFDLIYNPEKTAFLAEGEKYGAKIMNGRHMLEKQADRAWEIWNS